LLLDAEPRVGGEIDVCWHSLDFDFFTGGVGVVVSAWWCVEAGVGLDSPLLGGLSGVIRRVCWW
jgi:hypothetical protein